MSAKPKVSCLVLSSASLLIVPWATMADSPPLAARATPVATPAQAAPLPQLALPPAAIQALRGLPAFEPGLWEFRRTVESAARPTDPDTVTKCSDPLSDIRRKMTEMMRKGCRIQGMTYVGNRLHSSWSCLVEDGAVAVSNLITADTPTSYQDVNEARYEQKSTRSVVTAKRVGACPAAEPAK